jgi:hypothetical protein
MGIEVPTAIIIMYCRSRHVDLQVDSDVSEKQALKMDTACLSETSTSTAPKLKTSTTTCLINFLFVSVGYIYKHR